MSGSPERLGHAPGHTGTPSGGWRQLCSPRKKPVNSLPVVWNRNNTGACSHGETLQRSDSKLSTRYHGLKGHAVPWPLPRDEAWAAQGEKPPQGCAASGGGQRVSLLCFNEGQ